MIAETVAGYQGQSDEDLYATLGTLLLGEGHGVAPAEAERFRRFAKSWLDNKKRQLRRRIEDSETYRFWAATAGPEQTLEPVVVAGILADQGEEEDTAASSRCSWRGTSSRGRWCTTSLCRSRPNSGTTSSRR